MGFIEERNKPGCFNMRGREREKETEGERERQRERNMERVSERGRETQKFAFQGKILPKECASHSSPLPIVNHVTKKENPRTLQIW